MDLANYWQEEKRFLVSVGIGAAVFAAAWIAIDSTFGSKLGAARARRARIEADLKQGFLSAADLDRARAENEALRAACDTLGRAIEFTPRPAFRLEKGVPATTRAFKVLERTREELRTLAGRAGMSLPGDLGMPASAPTKEQALTRHLEALDAIDQTVRLAVEAGAQRIDSIRVKLDPRVESGKPIEDIERTQVEFELIGASLPLTRLLALLQTPRDGRVLAVQRASIEPARAKSDEVRLELVLLIAHLNGVAAAPAEEDGA